MENPLFRFVFVLPLAQQPVVPKTSIKEQFPQSLGLKRRRVVYRASRDHFPPPLSPGSGGLPKSTTPAHLWNRVRAVALKPPLQVVTRKPVPPADMRSGLFSPYFIVPKKGGGLRPILDLRVLNRALHKLPFKMFDAETNF